MSNKKRVSKLTVFLLVDAIVIISLILLLQNYIETKVDEITVYRFTQNLPANIKIEEKNIEAVSIPSRGVNENIVRDSSELVGKYTSDKVYKGQLVDDRYIVESGREDALTNVPAEDQKKLRKISIPADMISTWGGSIEKGDRVDLAFIGKVEYKNTVTDEKMDDVEYTKVFLQNVLVYDVLSSSGSSYIKPEDRPDIIVDPNNPEAAEVLKAEIANRSDIKTVILAVTIEQYEEIVARQQVGEVVLVGRFEGSESVVTDGFAMGPVPKPVQIGSAKVESKKAEIVNDETRKGW